MDPKIKGIIETVVIAAVLVFLVIFLFPFIPGLPVVVTTVVVIGIVLLASFHIIQLLGWW